MSRPGENNTDERGSGGGNPPTRPTVGRGTDTSSCPAPGTTVGGMTEWRSEHRPPTVREAKAYLEAHRHGGGDAAALEECHDVVDSEDRRAHGRPASDETGVDAPPFPKPPEDQLEEEGAD